MSSSDPASLRPPVCAPAFAPALAMAGALVLAACTVQPLYGPTPTGASVTTAVSQIAIDPVDTRVAQESATD